MNFISRHFRHTIFLAATASLVATASLPAPLCAQPAPPNTTIEIPGRALGANTEQLPLLTWEELQEKIGGPTLVSLHVEKMPILNIIEEMNRQAPVPVQAYNPTSASWNSFAGKLFSANYDAQPLWSVARDLARQMKIGVSSSTEGVQFVPWGAESSALVTTSGPCVFTLTNVIRQRFLGEAADKAAPGETLQLNGHLYLDPKVPWQSRSLALLIEEAVDENEQSVLLDSDIDLSNYSHYIDLKLAVQPRASQLKLLRGSLHGVVAFDAQRWEVPDVMQAKNVEKFFGEGDAAMRLEMQEVKKVGDDYQVVMVVSQNKGGLGDMLRVRKLSTGKTVLTGSESYEKVQLLDDKNRALKRVKIEPQLGGDTGTRIITITSTFRPVQSEEENLRTETPAKLVLDYASDYRELVVPFEFKDIPLP